MDGYGYDSFDGRLVELLPTEESVIGRSVVRELIADLPPVERRVLRWLHGIECEQLDPEEIAWRMNASETQVWQWADRAVEYLGHAALMVVAA